MNEPRLVSEDEQGRTKSHGWRDLGVHTMEMGDFKHEVHLWTKGGCKVLTSREDHNGKMRYHLSISREDRYPGWDEIKDARYALLPMGLHFAQILPPASQYTNIHQNCFHLWEIDDGQW